VPIHSKAYQEGNELFTSSQNKMKGTVGKKGVKAQEEESSEKRVKSTNTSLLVKAGGEGEADE